MTQRDYVGRGKSLSRWRKTSNHKKKRSFSGTSKTMIALGTAVLITFIGSLYFIAHNKLDDVIIVPNRGKNTSSGGLPPKPEERWRYIKELENRQIGVQAPTEPTARRELNAPMQLTDEQRQILEQMQADMSREPTHLNEVLSNDQTKVPAADTAQNRLTTQILLNPFSQQPVEAPSQTPPRTVAPQPGR